MLHIEECSVGQTIRILLCWPNLKALLMLSWPIHSSKLIDFSSCHEILSIYEQSAYINQLLKLHKLPWPKVSDLSGLHCTTKDHLHPENAEKLLCGHENLPLLNFKSVHIRYIKEKLIFVTFSCDNRRTSTPKTIYFLNQHDKGNVLGPFSLGLGSGFGCRRGFANQLVKEVLIAEKQAQSTVLWHF